MGKVTSLKKMIEQKQEINGMRVTGPLFDIYKKADKYADQFNLPPSAVKSVIEDVVGHTPHSNGIKIEIEKQKKTVKIEISKLPGDSKYVKRPGISKDSQLEDERILNFMNHLQDVLKKEDGESFDGEPKFNTVRMGEVANSLSALSDLLGAMGSDPDLTAQVSSAAGDVEKITGASIDQDDVYKTLKALDVNSMLKNITAAFKSYEDSKMTLKYGRKTVDPKAALVNFQTVFKKAISDLMSQGLDVNKVR